ncbi:MAG: TolC family protein [Acidiferrobacter sp.]
MRIKNSMMWALALISVMMGAFGSRANGLRLSLRAAENLATRHNPSLAAARYSIDIARGRAQQDRLWPNPQLVVSGSIGSPLGSPGEFNSSAMLTQAIPLTGQIVRHAAAGRIGVAIAQAHFTTLVWRIRARVARAYERLVSATIAIPVAKHLVAADTELLRLTVARARAAQVSALAVSSARLLRAQAQLLVSRWQTRGERAREDLLRLTGYRPRQPWSVTHQLHWRAPTTAAAIATALAARPDLRMAHWEHRYAQALYRYQRARRGGWMTIGVGVDLGRAVLRGVPPQPLDRAIGLSASIPLPFWNRNQGARAAARARALYARGQARALRWQIQRTISQDLVRLRVLVARAHHYARLRNTTDAAVTLALLGLDLGQIHTASTVAVFTDQLTTTTAWLRTESAARTARMDVRITLGGPREPPQ